MDIVGLFIAIPAMLLLVLFFVSMVLLAKVLLPELWDDDDLISSTKSCKVINMGLHTPEQIETKKEAIDIATQSFVMNYSEGFFERNDPEFLYHSIESLNQLVVELKRGDTKE